MVAWFFTLFLFWAVASQAPALLCSTLFCCAVLCWTELCFAFLCYVVRCCVEFNLFRGNNEDHRPQSRPLVVRIYMCIICWYCKQCACSLASNLINIHLNRTGCFCCFSVAFNSFIYNLDDNLQHFKLFMLIFCRTNHRKSFRQKIPYDFSFIFTNRL